MTTNVLPCRNENRYHDLQRDNMNGFYPRKTKFPGIATGRLLIDYSSQLLSYISRSYFLTNGID